MNDVNNNLYNNDTIPEEELAGGGFFGASANAEPKREGVFCDLSEEDCDAMYGDEQNDIQGAFTDTIYENSLLSLFSELISDACEKANAPIECSKADDLACNPAFANSVLIAYLAEKGSVETKLEQAILSSMPPITA